MIGSLRGEILDVDRVACELLIEVGGVGYRVQGTPALMTGMVVGETSFLHAHHHIREDADILYGFATIDERRVFEAVISAHGVGPSLGLAILSVHGPAELQSVLASEDIDALCLVPGVGKKTATRLLIELKSKLNLPEVDLTAIETGGIEQATGPQVEVRQALEALGYSGDEVRTVLVKLPTDGDPAILTRDALRLIAEGV